MYACGSANLGFFQTSYALQKCQPTTKNATWTISLLLELRMHRVIEAKVRI